MTLEILTPGSLQWEMFWDLLVDAMTEGLPEDTWRCDGDGTGDSDPTLVHRCAKQAMAEMGNIDIEGTLAFFREHGGHCDCEIMFNVENSCGYKSARSPAT
jgi:hypothetical protein